jgi:hypothetical protein
MGFTREEQANPLSESKQTIETILFLLFSHNPINIHQTQQKL